MTSAERLSIGRLYAFELQMQKLLENDYFCQLVHKVSLDTDKDDGRMQTVPHPYFENILDVMRSNPGGDYMAHNMNEKRMLILGEYTH